MKTYKLKIVIGKFRDGVQGEIIHSEPLEMEVREFPMVWIPIGTGGCTSQKMVHKTIKIVDIGGVDWVVSEPGGWHSNHHVNLPSDFYYQQCKHCKCPI